MDENITKEIGTLSVNVKGVVEKTTAIEKTANEAKEEVKNLSEWRVSKEEADKKNQAALDEMIAAKKQLGLSGVSLKSYEADIEEHLTRDKDKLGKGAKFSIEIPNRKVVGNFSSSGSLTGTYFVAPDVRPGIIIKPYEAIHLRDLLPVGRTGSNIIRYIRDNGGQGGPAMTAEAGTKPQMDRALQVYDAPVRKVATYMRVPEEMIEDIPYLTSFLTNIGTQEVMLQEDTQILYGDGTGQNLTGLMTAGSFTAFAAGTSVIGASSNQFDVLRAARKQMRKLFRTPSWALVSPDDYFAMTSLKDTTNNYILQGGGNGLVPNLDGVPIIETTSIAAGDFLLGDRNAAEIVSRSGIAIRFYEQDQDNAIKNMVTIVIEERLALPIYYATGFIKGTFATAITDLTS